MASLIRLENGASYTKMKELQTTISSLETSITTGKSTIAEAITEKGVDATSDDSFDVLASCISSIATGKQFATGTFTLSATKNNHC